MNFLAIFTLIALIIGFVATNPIVKVYCSFSLLIWYKYFLFQPGSPTIGLIPCPPHWPAFAGIGPVCQRVEDIDDDNEGAEANDTDGENDDEDDDEIIFLN